MFTATHLHAMIVHFPVALVLVAFVSELAGIFLKKKFYQQVSLYILVLAALGAIAAFITGDIAGDGMDGGSLQQALVVHKQACIYNYCRRSKNYTGTYEKRDALAQNFGLYFIVCCRWQCCPYRLSGRSARF